MQSFPWRAAPPLLLARQHSVRNLARIDNQLWLLPATTLAAPRRQPAGRRVLHVQSISEWAPSCIGPYSQATRDAGLAFFAGQVGGTGGRGGAGTTRLARGGMPG